MIPKFTDWLLIKEGFNEPRKGMKSRWSVSYKKSIDCSHPKGFSQKNYCKRKARGGKYLESTIGTEDVDFSQIEQRYAKAKISVMLVRLYDQMTNQKLLTNISTIANLSGSAYGVYVSSENKKAIGSDIVNKIKMIYPNDPALGEKLQKLPKKVLLQYIPHLDEKKIVPSDVIHVDVNRHLSNLGDTPAAILEIASTIVHEATHVLEYETTGHTEDGPNTPVEIAERKFKAWCKQNWKMLQQKFGFQGDYPFRM